MGRLRLACAILFALVASSQLCLSHGGQDPVAAEPSSSYLKGWSDWAQGKFGSAGKKSEEAPAAASGWSDWAYNKISSFSNSASKDAEKAAQSAEGKVKSGGHSAAKAGKETLEGAKAGVKHGSDKGAEYVDKASEAGEDVAGHAKHKLKQETEL